MKIQFKMRPPSRAVASFLSLAICALSSMAFAAGEDGLDPATRTVLITKLEKVHDVMGPDDPMRTLLTLRLADYYSERARLDALKELDAGCVQCSAGKADRARAIALYEETLPFISVDKKRTVLTQVGHLQELTGQKTSAIHSYQAILKDGKSENRAHSTGAKSEADAQLSLAEIYYKDREFSKARDLYIAVRDNPAAQSRGLAAYRVGWCEFNLGLVSEAIASLTQLLRNQDLLKRGANSSTPDELGGEQFAEEVSRDLAVFVSHDVFSLKEIEQVYALSPVRTKIANLTAMAIEAERHDQISSALATWRFALLHEKKITEQFATEAHLAQLELTKASDGPALEALVSALGLWQKAQSQCHEECQDVQDNHALLRQIVLDWNQKEKTKPSKALLTAIRVYSDTFPAEGDMALWAAKVASRCEDNHLAYELSSRAEKALRTDAQTAKSEAVDSYENALLMEIESAELLKSDALRATSYEHYLASSLTQKKRLKVQYQLAHMTYDRGQTALALEQLRAVALSANLKSDADDVVVKKQAAELALDAAVLLKDDTRVEKLAREFAVALPNERENFSKMARTAVLNQTALTMGQATNPGTGAADADLKASWANLERFDIASASDREKIIYYKNRLILAEKLKRYGDARTSVLELLKVPGLSAEDEQFALARRLWLAELDLDFKQALAVTEKFHFDEANHKWLKLAMYAELAEQDPAPFFRAALKSERDPLKSAALAATLVRSSNDPLAEIEKHHPILLRNPEQLAQLYLEIYAKTPSAQRGKIVKIIENSPSVMATEAGKAIAQNQLLEQIGKLSFEIKNHQIDSKSQKTLAQSMKKRVVLLQGTDQLATRAIASENWATEILALNLVATENERFYQEVLSLPVPPGLSPTDEQQYLSLLSQTAAPHQTRANEIQKKLQEFWAHAEPLEPMAAG